MVNADPLTYKIEGETVTVVDCDESASGELVIPSKYKGKPVTSIGNYAFFLCSSLTSVSIPESITSIEGAAAPSMLVILSGIDTLVRLLQRKKA